MKQVLLVLFLLASFLIAGFSVWQVLQVSQSRSNTVPTSTKSTNQSSTLPTITDTKKTALLANIPALFTGIDWEIFEPNRAGDEKLLGHMGLYIDYEPYTIAGTEWQGLEKNLTREEMDKLRSDFRSYYGDELTKRGWETNVKVNKHSIDPLNADGPGGSVWGYITVRDGKLREVLLQEVVPIEDFGGVAKCPCDIGYKLFVSDIISLDSLIQR